MLPSIDPTGLVQWTILLSFVSSLSTKLEVGFDRLILPVVEGFLFWLILESFDDEWWSFPEYQCDNTFEFSIDLFYNKYRYRKHLTAYGMKNMNWMKLYYDISISWIYLYKIWNNLFWGWLIFILSLSFRSLLSASLVVSIAQKMKRSRMKRALMQVIGRPVERCIFLPWKENHESSFDMSSLSVGSLLCHILHPGNRSVSSHILTSNLNDINRLIISIPSLYYVLANCIMNEYLEKMLRASYLDYLSCNIDINILRVYFL